MKKIFLAFFILTFFSSFISSAQTFGGGTGTAADPYQIATVAHLKELSTFVMNDPDDSGDATSKNTYDKYWKLMNDLDFTGVTDFIPIGGCGDNVTNNGSKWFAGTFDGGGFTVKNLTIEQSDKDYVGLFGYNVGVVKNLGVVGGTVSGSNNVGGLVGRNSGTIENCYNTGSVTGNGYVGGLVGWNNNGATVANCYAAPASITSWTTNKGVLIGYWAGGTLSNCYYLKDLNIEGISGWGFNDEQNLKGKTVAELKTTAMIDLLNGSRSSGAWKEDLIPNINYGYPILNRQNLPATYHTVKFSVIDGSPVQADIAIESGQKIMERHLTAPVWTGSGAPKFFKAWCTESATTHLWDFDNAVTNTMTLYAKWTEARTVTFISNNSTLTTVNIPDGNTLPQPVAPTQTGYSFGGWFEDNNTFNTPWDFEGNLVTVDVTLYAKWDNLNDALDNATLVFQTNNVQWTVVTEATAKGGSCVKSGTIGNNGSTEVSTTITGPVVVSFNYKVSSEDGWDFLEFLVEGTLMESWSGTSETDWRTYHYGVPAGSHTLTWKYTKDVINSDGDDCAWIDNIQLITEGVVFFSGNGNTAGDAPEMINGVSVILPDEGRLVKSGYVFTGWNTAADGSGTSYAAGATSPASGVIVLYAQWKINFNGAGTDADPYQIATMADLQTLSTMVMTDLSTTGMNTVGKFFKLMNNIDMTSADFIPIGGWDNPTSNNIDKFFAGTFDGDGHKIFNLIVSKTGMNYVGLFGRNFGDIKYLGVEGGTMEGNVYVGGLVGENYGTVADGYATGSVTGNDYVGGLVGENYGTVADGYATGSVTGNDYVGGLVGWNNNGATVANCYAAPASITSWTTNKGVLIGYWAGGTLSNCYYLKDLNIEGISGWGFDDATNLKGKTVAELKTTAMIDLLNGSPSSGAWKEDLIPNINYGYPILSWQAKRIVSFSVDGGSSTGSLTTIYGNTITQPTDPTKSGYTFGGWYKDTQFTTAWNFTTDVVTADMTLYAKWTINSYTVTFSVDGGSSTGSLTTIYGSTITQPTDPTKSGYTFGGWYKDTQFTTAWNFTTDVVTADMTLYAKWTAITYTVAYSGNGNTSGTVSADQSKTYGTPLTLATVGTLVKTGFVFTGWNTAADGSGTTYTAGSSLSADLSTTANEIITLYAKWIDENTTYTVSYSINNGTGTAPANQSVTVGNSITLPAGSGLSKEGYTFAGWNTAANGSGTDYAAGSSYAVMADITLYAKWTINSYTVTFSVDGGSSTGSLTTIYGSTITQPTDPTKSGYTFGGWYKDTEFVEVWDFTTDVVTADITLYAKWTAEPTGILDMKVAELKLYPNPATTVLNIDLTATDISTTDIERSRNVQSVDIFDITGKLVLQVPAAAVIDISTLPQGTYIVKAGNYRGKVLKN